MTNTICTAICVTLFLASVILAQDPDPKEVSGEDRVRQMLAETVEIVEEFSERLGDADRKRWDRELAVLKDEVELEMFFARHVVHRPDEMSRNKWIHTAVNQLASTLILVEIDRPHPLLKRRWLAHVFAIEMMTRHWRGWDAHACEWLTDIDMRLLHMAMQMLSERTVVEKRPLPFPAGINVELGLPLDYRVDDLKEAIDERIRDEDRVFEGVKDRIKARGCTSEHAAMLIATTHVRVANEAYRIVIDEMEKSQRP